MVLVLGDAIGISETRDYDRKTTIGNLTIGDDRAVFADNDSSAVVDGLARRRACKLDAGWKRSERAGHGNHHRLDRVFGGLIVQDGENANLVSLECAAHVELLQALQTRQHEEVRLDHGIVNRAAGGFLLLLLGEFGCAGIRYLAP